jgi:hypothetical protein
LRADLCDGAVPYTMRGSMNEDTKNAKIANTMLGFEDHGILTFWIQLDFGGAGQGFGGWALDGKPTSDYGDRAPIPECGAIIAAILRTLEVDSWEKLPGQIVRVRGTHSGLIAIGHALKDMWCEPKKIFESMKATA